MTCAIHQPNLLPRLSVLAKLAAADVWIVFKQLRAARLPLTCTGCPFNNPRDCQEGYYGVCVYLDQHATWQVGVCLQRMDLCQSLEDFNRGPLRTEILALRETEYRHLTDRYRTE